jgi:hypothetical protein
VQDRAENPGLGVQEALGSLCSVPARSGERDFRLTSSLPLPTGTPGSFSDMAALPNLDHLSMEDFREVYEPSDDTFLLMDALEADSGSLQTRRPTIAVEIG